MGRRKADPRWGEAERERLGYAIEQAGHGQAGCIAELVDAYGIEPVSQPSLSRWIDGTTRTPCCVDALLAYCERYAPVADIRIADVGESAAAAEAIATAGWDRMRQLSAELARTKSRLREERRRAGRLARTVERMSDELARLLEQSE